MLARNLMNAYKMMRALGLVRSKRDYSRRWLGRGQTYLRDYELRGRDFVQVPAATVTRLRSRLRAVADRVPAGIRTEIEAVIATIDQGTAVADLLARRG
ncbi:DUF6626 family protein [Microvirga makkahensis]|uniref:Uncharacterized protein n=1 Tax=Microvirga makkahensis TaxID=1128670 RepID=A0A7X3MPP9_9HYPH|nr:DUF6626 family protein [Microvirga makkahensis]MXQ10951.1 hypothetical protein [Microvirga makkahensis]